jgi:hypothetical protein
VLQYLVREREAYLRRIAELTGADRDVVEAVASLLGDLIQLDWPDVAEAWAGYVAHYVTGRSPAVPDLLYRVATLAPLVVRSGGWPIDEDLHRLRHYPSDETWGRASEVAQRYARSLAMEASDAVAAVAAAAYAAKRRPIYATILAERDRLLYSDVAPLELLAEYVRLYKLAMRVATDVSERDGRVAALMYLREVCTGGDLCEVNLRRVWRERHMIAPLVEQLLRELSKQGICMPSVRGYEVSLADIYAPRIGVRQIYLVYVCHRDRLQERKA